jgi:Glycosyl transferases group 1/Glycosyltransferase Family 4
MRILHLDAGKDMRGGQWQVLRLIGGLAAAGIESTLLARESAPLYTAARKEGWRVAPIGLPRALSMVRNHDLVHAHDGRSHTLGMLLPRIPLVVARRVAFPVGSRWKYGRARRYIAVSEFVKSVLVYGGVPVDKVSVVYDGVPVLETAHGDRILAPANAGDPMKGAPLAQEAASLAGVTLATSADLERDLPNAALFLYVTHTEGLGSAALLAMSAGVPVIASRTGGLPEIVRDRETGLLVENAPQPIAQALRELLDDRARAREMGAEGRRAVIANFTVAHMVRRTIEVYRQVLV